MNIAALLFLCRHYFGVCSELFWLPPTWRTMRLSALSSVGGTMAPRSASCAEEYFVVGRISAYIWYVFIYCSSYMSACLCDLNTNCFVKGWFLYRMYSELDSFVCSHMTGFNRVSPVDSWGSVALCVGRAGSDRWSWLVRRACENRPHATTGPADGTAAHVSAFVRVRIGKLRNTLSGHATNILITQRA